jgi:hypothetical protein
MSSALVLYQPLEATLWPNSRFGLLRRWLIPHVDDLHRVLPNKVMVMRLRLIWPHLRCCERRRLRQICRGFADLALGYDSRRCEYWRTYHRVWVPFVTHRTNHFPSTIALPWHTLDK